MSTQIFNTDRTIPAQKITITNNSEEVIAQAITLIEKQMLAALYGIVADARDMGSYRNLTGNARRFISPNMNVIKDIMQLGADRLAFTNVTVQRSDSSGSEIRKQYIPPGDMDDAVVKMGRPGSSTIAEGWVGALMPYSAKLESQGYDVLSGAFLKFISNPARYFNNSVETKSAIFQKRKQ